MIIRGLLVGLALAVAPMAAASADDEVAITVHAESGRGAWSDGGTRPVVIAPHGTRAAFKAVHLEEGDRVTFRGDVVTGTHVVWAVYSAPLEENSPAAYVTIHAETRKGSRVFVYLF